MNPDWSQPPAINTSPTRPRRSTRTAISVFLLCVLLAIASSGIVWYRSAREVVAEHVSDALHSVAKLKLAQIESWLDDNRRTLALAIASPAFDSALRAWHKTGRRNDPAMLDQLHYLAALGRFPEVSLYDADGLLLLSTAPAISAPRLKTGAGEGEVTLDDFHVISQDHPQQIVIGLTSPLSGKAQAGKASRIHVTLDQNRRLLPLLQQWGGESLSGETLLFRREGGDVVYLNTLRHNDAPPLSLRLPMTTPDLLTGRLLRGERGALAGVDYRQIPSLAYGMAVPGTPWFIIVKTDSEEAFADLNMLAASGAILFAILLLSVAALFGIRQQRLTIRHRQEVAHLQLARRYEILVRYANDAIIIVDAEHRIVDINERGLNTYQYRPEELLGRFDDCLLASGQPDSTESLPPLADGQPPLFREALHQRKDGSVFPVEISEVASEIDGAREIHKIVRDISERKANENRIARLSSLSATLSIVNHAQARASCLEEVFELSCRACIEAGKFKLAWIGLADKASGLIRIAHIWGTGQDFIAGTELSIDPRSTAGYGPSVIAFLEQRACICNDYATDPQAQHWRDQAAASGIGSSVSVPISRDGVAIGVLTAYSEQVHAFDSQAEYLLAEIADSLSFAMHHFAEQAAKHEAESALRRREQQLLKAEEQARLGHWEIDLVTGKSEWSPQMFRLFKRSPLLGPPALDDTAALPYTPDSALLTEQCLRKAISTQQNIQLEQELLFADGRPAFHATLIVPVCDEQGKTIGLQGTTQDITEHKMNESRLIRMAHRLAQSAKEYEDLYQQAPCGYHSLDADGVFLRINDTELKWLGYTRAEVIGKMKFVDLLPADRQAEFLHDFPRSMKNALRRNQELNLLTRDGRIIPVLLNETVVFDEIGNFRKNRTTVVDMSERQKIEKERAEYARRMTLLSRRLVNMQEEAKKRLSAALHDHTSPNLAAIGLNLSTIGLLCKDEISPDLAERLEDIRALVEDTAANIREISSELRPPMLDYAGLVPALEGYLYQFSRRTGTQTRFACGEFPVRLPPEHETLLFRIAQEALTNCAKHAMARSVELALENDDGTIRLAIKDDGNGFDPDGLSKNGQSCGLGLLNMREMTEFSGGRFSIDARPGKGTEICVEI